jgi:hypothetical protein
MGLTGHAAVPGGGNGTKTMNSTHQTSGPAAARPRRGARLRAGAVAALAAAGLVAAAGCQPTSVAAGGSASAAPAQASTATPVLGKLAGLFAHGSGFGRARPAEIFLGGDPTGLVTKITWQSWGAATARGTGTSTYVAGNQSVAAGTQQRATVVAFDLGTCHGKLMYRAVEWYFPQRGGVFSASHYENVCTGTFVPAS